MPPSLQDQLIELMLTDLLKGAKVDPRRAFHGAPELDLHDYLPWFGEAVTRYARDPTQEHRSRIKITKEWGPRRKFFGLFGPWQRGPKLTSDDLLVIGAHEVGHHDRQQGPAALERVRRSLRARPADAAAFQSGMPLWKIAQAQKGLHRTEKEASAKAAQYIKAYFEAIGRTEKLKLSKEGMRLAKRAYGKGYHYKYLKKAGLLGLLLAAGLLAAQGVTSRGSQDGSA